MKDITLNIHRFEGEIDVGTLIIESELRTQKLQQGVKEAKKELAKLEKKHEEFQVTLNGVNTSVSTVVKSFSEMTDKTVGIDKIKSSISSLLNESKKLDKQISNMKKQTSMMSPDFLTNVDKLKNASILKANKLGVIPSKMGITDDRNQLLKERNYLVDEISNKIKFINSEDKTRLSIGEKRLQQLNQELSAEDKNHSLLIKRKEQEEKIARIEEEKHQKEINNLDKELQKYISNQQKKEMLEQQAKQEQQVKIDFQQTYTDLGSPELTEQYRAQYRALMDLLQPEQQDLVIKKLMAEESKKLVNNTIAQIQKTKEQTLATNQSITVIDRIRMALNKMSVASEKTKTNFKSMINTLKTTAVTWRILSGVFNRIITLFANMYEAAASYEESINLYTVALGEYAEQGRTWATKISDALYLDPKDIMQYTGAFYNLVQGLGVASDAAYTMATNLTQLSYDMSSYLNIDVEAAHDKLQSAITGQSRAVASAGIAMQQASLQELAYSLGITKTVATMSQAEKTYLRYIQILRSTTNMQGDLARTIITPENALRVIRTQFTLLSRAIGQVFIPVVLKVIPYVMLLVEALKRLANWLAKWTGYKIADVDYSNIKILDTYLENVGDTATGTGEAVGNAVKKIKDELGNLASFDELNVVTFDEDTSKGSGAGAGIGGGGVIDTLKDLIDGYDMLEGLTSQFNEQLDSARENVKKMIPYVKILGALFLGWKLTKMFMESIVFVDGFLKAWSSVKTLGLFAKLPSLTSILNAPFLTNLPAAFSIIGESISGMVSGTIAVSDGLSLILSAVGEIAIAFAGVAAIIGGIVITIKGIKKIINGDTFKGVLTVIEGIAIAVAGVALLFGGWVVAAVAAVVAITAAVITHWDKVKAFFVNLWNNITTKVVEVSTFIMATLAPMVNWIKTNVVDPIWNVVGPVLAKIIEAYKSAFETAKNIATTIYEMIAGYFSSMWEISSTIFGNMIEIITGIVEPVYTVFKKVWEIVFSVVSDISKIIRATIELILEILKPIATWVWTNVLSPIVGFFTSVVTSVNDKVIEPLLTKFRNFYKSIKDIFTTIATTVSDTIGNALKGVLNGIFTLIETKINGFIDGLNTVRTYINKILPEKYELKYISHISIPRFAEGGYPDSGDLFFANENGIPEYITSIGNRSAVVNQQQMVTALTNAIVQGLSNMSKPEDNQPINVYIGNDKVYSGLTKYAKRQNNIYGTNVIKV